MADYFPSFQTFFLYWEPHRENQLSFYTSVLEIPKHLSFLLKIDMRVLVVVTLTRSCLQAFTHFLTHSTTTQISIKKKIPLTISSHDIDKMGKETKRTKM